MGRKLYVGNLPYEVGETDLIFRIKKEGLCASQPNVSSQDLTRDPRTAHCSSLRCTATIEQL